MKLEDYYKAETYYSIYRVRVISQVTIRQLFLSTFEKPHEKKHVFLKVKSSFVNLKNGQNGQSWSESIF